MQGSIETTSRSIEESYLDQTVWGLGSVAVSVDFLLPALSKIKETGYKF